MGCSGSKFSTYFDAIISLGGKVINDENEISRKHNLKNGWSGILKYLLPQIFQNNDVLDQFYGRIKLGTEN